MLCRSLESVRPLKSVTFAMPWLNIMPQVMLCRLHRSVEPLKSVMFRWSAGP